MSEKTYEISPPPGNAIVSKETMTEEELREFAIQSEIEIVSLESAIKQLRDQGYTITEQ